MARARTSDGIELYFEEFGSGEAIVFVHEFGGNYWSWEPQIGYFSRRYRCVTFAARGFAPSDIPENVSRYSQARAVDDIFDVMDAAKIEKAHLIGLSMGGFAVLHAALRSPDRVLSAVAAGTGYGAEKEWADYFRNVSEGVAEKFEKLGAKEFAPVYASGPSRVQFQNKDPRGWALFAQRLGLHSDHGAANTMRGVQMRRPSLYDLEGEFKKLDVPVLVMTGDEDDHCLQTGIFLKKAISRAGLAVFPKAGHTLNLEEPDLFNRIVSEYLAQVEAGKWERRDPRANGAQIMKTE
ncbi:alpha/beta hydrolase (plasmid) [Rhizobium sp. CB3171]|uniref:alpha/beta fold hydrolase n=1 Tax=Rhizobium sp. CB3171 TaxID=3039157 RepID=UPI0024B22F34|nr:alpha/beta hydrolase [Rhizobium sp. CB3171]WFU06934.1 alpha/beta hydrolase [Rhizobium sp. CB3171]